MDQQMRHELWCVLASAVGRIEEHLMQRKKLGFDDDLILAQVLAQVLAAEALDRIASQGITTYDPNAV